MDAKIIRTAGIMLLVLLILGTAIALLFYWNSLILRGLVSDFKSELRAAEGIEIIETVSEYGKLNGNGNGINFFGAVLVKAEDPDVLDALVSLNKDFELLDYYKQEKREIDLKYAQRAHLSFENLSPDYYVVWFYESAHPHANLLDIKGH
ncbi:MAG: hypothetical protein J6S14_06060 [Clostridia bacterium]|nr:hypothetical protein [Clostridia bacterium]